MSLLSNQHSSPTKVDRINAPNDSRAYKCNQIIHMAQLSGRIRSLVRQSCITWTMLNNHDCAVLEPIKLSSGWRSRETQLYSSASRSHTLWSRPDILTNITTAKSQPISEQNSIHFQMNL